MLSSCTKEVTTSDLVIRNGIKYEINAKEPFTGNVIDYHSNGQIKHKATLIDGTPDGLVENFYPNGQLNFQEKYTNKIIEDGEVQYFNPSGRLTSLLTYKNGLRDGPGKRFDATGNLVSLETYKNWMRDGLTKIYEAFNDEYLITEESNWSADKLIDTIRFSTLPNHQLLHLRCKVISHALQ